MAIELRRLSVLLVVIYSVSAFLRQERSFLSSVREETRCYVTGSSRGGRQREESRRQARVAQMVRVELSQLIQNPYMIKSSDRVSADVLAATSVVDVEVSPDLRSATASVTTRGDSASKRAAFAWLVRNEKSVRYALAAQLRHIKRVPEVRFRKSDVSSATELMALIDRVADDDDELDASNGFPDGPIDGLDFDELDDEEYQDPYDDVLTPEEYKALSQQFSEDDIQDVVGAATKVTRAEGEQNSEVDS